MLKLKAERVEFAGLVRVCVDKKAEWETKAEAKITCVSSILHFAA